MLTLDGATQSVNRWRHLVAAVMLSVAVIAIASFGAAEAQNGDAPTGETPADQVYALGEVVELQIVAQDPNGLPLMFQANGLPDGLIVDSGSGLISGAPAAVGVFTVDVVVSNGAHFTRLAFVITVSNDSIGLTPTPTPTLTVGVTGTATPTAVTGTPIPQVSPTPVPPTPTLVPPTPEPATPTPDSIGPSPVPVVPSATSVAPTPTPPPPSATATAPATVPATPLATATPTSEAAVVAPTDGSDTEEPTAPPASPSPADPNDETQVRMAAVVDGVPVEIFYAPAREMTQGKTEPVTVLAREIRTAPAPTPELPSDEGNFVASPVDIPELVEVRLRAASDADAEISPADSQRVRLRAAGDDNVLQWIHVFLVRPETVGEVPLILELLDSDDVTIDFFRTEITVSVASRPWYQSLWDLIWGPISWFVGASGSLLALGAAIRKWRKDRQPPDPIDLREPAEQTPSPMAP